MWQRGRSRRGRRVGDWSDYNNAPLHPYWVGDRVFFGALAPKDGLIGIVIYASEDWRAVEHLLATLPVPAKRSFWSRVRAWLRR